MGKPSISARSSTISFCNAGGIRVLRFSPSRVDEYSKRMEADLGSECAESTPANAVSIRWAVARRVLGVLIAMALSIDCGPVSGGRSWLDQRGRGDVRLRSRRAA